MGDGILCCRHLKGPFFEAPGVNSKPIFLPPEHLDVVSAAVQKDKDVAAQGISPHLFPYKSSQAIEALSYIGRLAVQKVPGGIVEAEHCGQEIKVRK